MVLVDYNQVLLAAISAGHSTFGADLNPDMIRHMFLNSILMYKNKFSPKYGEIVICCDGRNLWRKQVFAYYKAKRAQGRAESPLDWEMIFDTLAKLRDELDQFFPYKVICVDGAEGDDVIAVLAKYFHENEFIQEGLDEVRQPILIISADTDFIQLQEYENVSQWTPMFKKMLVESDPRRYRFNKIIRGDVGDGVPNIFSPDDALVDPNKRQTAATEKRVTPVLEACLAGADVPGDVAVNFDRNKKMIDLVDISAPQHIVLEILRQYREGRVAPKSELLAYFMKFRLSNLASSISKF